MQTLIERIAPLTSEIIRFSDTQVELVSVKGKRLRVGIDGAGHITTYVPNGPGNNIVHKGELSAEAEIVRYLSDHRTVKQAQAAYVSGDRAATRAQKDIRYRTVNHLRCTDAMIDRAERVITAGTLKMNDAAVRLIELGAW